MTEQRWPLPESWKWVQAAELGQIVGGGTPPASDPSNFEDEGGEPWVTPADLTGYEDTYISRGRRNLSKTGLASCGATLMPGGTVLYSSRAPIGYCVIASNSIATNQGFKSLILRDGIVPEYVRYYLLSAKDYAEGLASGTTFKELSGARMAVLSVPLSPEVEQRRIVAKLDNVLAKSRRARNELRRVPQLIERYKQAVLTAAFRGDLTRKWREGRHVAALTLTQSGIDGRAATLGPLPENWAWTAIRSVALVTGGLTKNSKRNSIANRVPYLRVANVYANELRLNEIAEIGCTEVELPKTRLQDGDLLIVEGNGSLEQIGRVAIWSGEVDGCSHQNHLIRARTNRHAIPRFVLYWLLSPSGRAVIEGVASSSSGLHTLSISKVEGLPIPVTAIDEQHEVVRLIETAFAWLDRVAGEHANASRLLPRLDQALLAKAFRGELLAPTAPDARPPRRESASAG